MNTYVPKRDDIRRDWWVVDAQGMTLGRVATAVASRLRGKHKPTFVPFLDTGDHVVIVNAAKVILTGQKATDKMYRWHSLYPGGLREVPAGKMQAKQPARMVEIAIRGMLPKGPLGRQMFRKLKVYAGPGHPHQAQKPQALAVPGAERRI